MDIAAFTDVTEEVLPPFTQSSKPWLDRQKTPMPSGVCVLDANNDGYPDLYFVSGQDFDNALMLNDGRGVFRDVTKEWGIVYNNNSAVSCIGVDLDNDGCDDIVMTGAFAGAPGLSGNVLLKNHYCSSNKQYRHFSDVTPDILRHWKYTLSASASDWDHDGLLDLYIASLPPLNLINFPGASPLEDFPAYSLLLHNRGNFTFDDISRQSGGANRATCPCMTINMDYDKDGLEDIVAINCGNDLVMAFDIQVFRNNGNLTFTDMTPTSGLVGPDAYPGMWMGAGVGDFDRDGCLDIVASNLASNPRFAYAPAQIIKGTCDKVSAFQMGDLEVKPVQGRTDLTLFSWGPIARDFNNDGILDFYWSGNYMATQHEWLDEVVDSFEVDPPAVGVPPPGYENDSDNKNNGNTTTSNNNGNRYRHRNLQKKTLIVSPGEFFYGLGYDDEYDFRVELSPVNLTEDFNIIMTSGDFNRDGALDVIVAIDNCVPGPRKGRPVILYGIPNDNQWIGIRLIGTAPTTNPQAIGAQVHLYKKDGSGNRQLLILLAGSGAMTSEEKTLFFGIGRNNNMAEYEVAVEWPGGQMEYFDAFTKSAIVLTNAIAVLRQGQGNEIGRAHV